MREMSVDFYQFVDENADTIPRYTCSEILFKTCLGTHQIPKECIRHAAFVTYIRPLGRVTWSGTTSLA